MRILAIGIGADTQDIFLLDTSQPVQNNVKMVMPSATEIAARRIRRSTLERRPLVLTGVTMGSGPCHVALHDHLSEGLTAYATERAALTFDDDLSVVRAMGVIVLSDDEAAAVRGAEHVVMHDLDLVAIRSALAAFEAPTTFDGLAIGCLDHGAPPPGVSERLFRFEHIRRVLRANSDLHAFALKPEEVPDYLTRARSMLAGRDIDVPCIFLDTGVAAALGALHEPRVRDHDAQLVLHLGNMHALGLHTSGTRVHAIFEHHTDIVSGSDLETMAERFVQRELTHEEVFGHQGHGVHYVDETRDTDPFVAVTGPQRGKLRGSRLHPHFATLHEDVMTTSSLGLVEGYAARHPNVREEIEAALTR